MSKTTKSVLALLALPCLLAATSVLGAELEVELADERWGGESVPEGEQCKKFGGSGKSPALAVSNIPDGAHALVVEFSDRSYPPMDDGGHGKIGYEIEPGAVSVAVPSVPGHTTDLPSGFFVVAEHEAPTWDEPGAYLPPCSGGRGNSYYLTVKAVHRMDDELHELASASLEMGKY